MSADTKAATPRPWETKPTRSLDALDVRETANGNTLLANIPRANAALIVEAVNAYDLKTQNAELVEALTEAGCRSARVYASGNTCAERSAAGETLTFCFVCAALANLAELLEAAYEEGQASLGGLASERKRFEKQRAVRRGLEAKFRAALAKAGDR